MRYDSLTEWCSPTVGWGGLARLRATGCLLGEGHVPVAHSDRRSWMGSPFAGGGRFYRPLAKAVPVPAPTQGMPPRRWPASACVMMHEAGTRSITLRGE